VKQQIKTYRKRILDVDFASPITISERDTEKQTAGAKSKNSTAKIVINSLQMMKGFIECVILLKQLLFQ
jgi:hypothetical protein